MNDTSASNKHNEFKIQIDRLHFEVQGPTITGAELRALESPPIGPDRGLFLTEPGPAADRPIAEADAVELRGGMHFFTAPANITPGHDAGCC
jgi:hypothetical protein